MLNFPNQSQSNAKAIDRNKISFTIYNTKNGFLCNRIYILFKNIIKSISL